MRTSSSPSRVAAFRYHSLCLNSGLSGEGHSTSRFVLIGEYRIIKRSMSFLSIIIYMMRQERHNREGRGLHRSSLGKPRGGTLPVHCTSRAHRVWLDGSCPWLLPLQCVCQRIATNLTSRIEAAS